MKIIFQYLSICSFSFFALLSLHGNAQENFDILILNGQIIDGTGNLWIEADVGIIDQRIVSIGNLENSQANRVIDASGLIVAPGFIDPIPMLSVASLITRVLKVHYARASQRYWKVMMAAPLFLSMSITRQ